jgi:hypothetical protein
MTTFELIHLLRDLKLEHDNFRVAYSRSFAQAALAPPGQVIAIVGPTRVGKTTLSRRLSADLVKAKPGRLERSIPLARVEAATTNQGKFSTKHFTLRFLEELADPINMGELVGFRRNQSETHLRIQLERCIRYRETSFLIVDEAHHLLRTPSQIRSAEVLDTLKCLGNSTGLVIILLGGYELLQSCFSSAHLNGRLTVIDFPPYTASADSSRELDRIFVTLDEMLPFATGNSLLGSRDFIFSGSLGCLGLLIGWTINALAEMQARGEHALRLKHFEVTRLVEQMRPIKEEIELGQSLLSQHRSTVQTLATDSSKSPKKAIKIKRRPGRRKPHRDPGPGGCKAA